MDELSKTTIGTAIITFLAKISGIFLYPMFLFFAYKWVSWNFNLPTLTYWEMVCIYGSFTIICTTLGRIFHKE